MNEPRDALLKKISDRTALGLPSGSGPEVVRA
jgi:hypothetical protein